MLDNAKRLPRSRVIAAGVVVFALIGVGVGFAVTSSGPARHLSAPPVPKTTTTTTTTVPRYVASRTICPLTDMRAPGGVVPRRPALLVKIGNEPDGARPQSGLNEADIVFDTPAEGFIMRYAAVYQCNNASSIGPTRSVRWVDWNMIARLFVRPILAFAGGINPNVDGVASKSWIGEADLLGNAASAGVRITSRVAPDNLYTSTQALYAMFKKRTAPPPPIFDYSASPPPGSTPATSVGINFSYGTDAIWQWKAASGLWLHTYSGSPDIDTLTGQQVSTTNIVLIVAHYLIGPFAENQLPGSGDVESQLQGSGAAYVFRDGRSVAVTWHRQDQLSKFTFTNAKGQAVDLAPGRTWVEIDPDTQAHAPGGITITR